MRPYPSAAKCKVQFPAMVAAAAFFVCERSSCRSIGKMVANFAGINRLYKAMKAHELVKSLRRTGKTWIPKMECRYSNKGGAKAATSIRWHSTHADCPR